MVSVTPPSRFIPGTHLIGGWVGLRAGLKQTKILCVYLITPISVTCLAKSLRRSCVCIFSGVFIVYSNHTSVRNSSCPSYTLHISFIYHCLDLEYLVKNLIFNFSTCRPNCFYRVASCSLRSNILASSMHSNTFSPYYPLMYLSATLFSS
jgi:hypothetical protein